MHRPQSRRRDLLRDQQEADDRLLRLLEAQHGAGVCEEGAEHDEEDRRPHQQRRYESVAPHFGRSRGLKHGQFNRSDLRFHSNGFSVCSFI